MLNIPAVNIIAGLITDVSLAKIDPYMRSAKLKVMDYELTFKLTNGLINGNTISIEFPPTFLIEDDPNYKMFYIKYGLENVDEFNPVGFEARTVGTDNYMYISNFNNFDDY